MIFCLGMYILLFCMPDFKVFLFVFSFPFFLYLFPLHVLIECSAALAVPEDFPKGCFRFVAVEMGDERVDEVKYVSVGRERDFDDSG